MNCKLYNDQHGIHAPFYGEIKGRLEVDFLIQKEHTIFRSRRRAVETSAATPPSIVWWRPHRGMRSGPLSWAHTMWKLKSRSTICRSIWWCSSDFTPSDPCSCYTRFCPSFRICCGVLDWLEVIDWLLNEQILKKLFYANKSSLVHGYITLLGYS